MVLESESPDAIGERESRMVAEWLSLVRLRVDRGSAHGLT
jgi:hypothetical protein